MDNNDKCETCTFAAFGKGWRGLCRAEVLTESGPDLLKYLHIMRHFHCQNGKYKQCVKD